jgi:cyclic pyranopterin phosphate synthase
MIDSYGRTIDYLRISVTDRCNLRCAYCMPPEGVRLFRHEAILTFEEITEVARTAAARGVTKIRLTGGEPLVRRDVVRLVGMLAGIEGVRDLAMTTNGTLLAAHAQALAAAGLRRVNISLDAIDAARYAAITRGGDVRQVMAGIDAARQAGLTPIRLNCVVAADSAEADAQDVTRFAAACGLEVRFIRRMNLSAGSFAVVEGGLGGDCPRCDRLRLSSDGRIRPCLL